ncbi:hypothetical protein Q022_02243 [Pseudomonas aeruginosa BWHPSA009]|nr:hypothetical protein Q022_02243 [Pseudomonas aeruginosa BWHPSA009]
MKLLVQVAERFAKFKLARKQSIDDDVMTPQNAVLKVVLLPGTEQLITDSGWVIGIGGFHTLVHLER